MTQLKVDVDQLSSMVGRLTRSIYELDSADYFSASTAELVGHDGLATKVREFSTNWNVKRGEVVLKVSSARDSVSKIAESFRALEMELQSSIDGSGSTNTTNTPSGSSAPSSSRSRSEAAPRRGNESAIA